MLPIIDRGTGMNKTETRYSEYLNMLKSLTLDVTDSNGEFEKVLGWKFEPIGLKLAQEKCFYYPDFLVVFPDRFECHEVKAFNKKAGKPLMKDDALVKIKVASSEFHWFRFKITWYNPNMSWCYREIKGGK